MRINFAHLCDYALLSQDRKMSVMGIFATILAFQVPWVHPTLYLAFEIGLEPAELNRAINVRLDCVDEDGQAVFAGESTVTTQGQPRIGDHPAVPQMLVLNHVTFNRLGPYNINFWLDGHLASTLPFDVRQHPNPPQPVALPRDV